jgi:CHAT domain-containing protein
MERLAREMARESRLMEALELAARQVEIHCRLLGFRHPETARSYLTLARVHLLCGNYSRAEELAFLALSRSRSLMGEDHPLVAEALTELGLVMKSTRRRETARRLYEEAIALLRATGGEGSLALAPVIGALGSLNRLEGRWDEAVPQYRQAIQILSTHLGENHPRVAEQVLWFAMFLTHMGRLDEALDQCARAETILRASGDTLGMLRRRLLGIEARIRCIRREFSAAESLYRASRMMQLRPIDETPLILNQGRVASGTPMGAETFLRVGRFDDAFWEMERATGWLSEGFFSLASKSSSGAAAAADTLGRRLAALETWFASLKESAGEQWPEALSDEEEGRYVRLLLTEVELARLERDLVRDTPGMTRASLLPFIQSTLAPDQAIVGWLESDTEVSSPKSGRRSLWGYIVRDRGPVRWVSLASRKTLVDGERWTKAILAYTRRIQRASALPVRAEPDSQLSALSRRVSRIVMDPLLPFLDGVRHLIVVDGRRTYELPVETLLLPDGNYVIDEYVVSYVPSALCHAQMARVRREEVPRKLTGALVVGDPVFRPEQLAEVPRDLSTLLENAPAPSVETALETPLLRAALSGDEQALSRLPRLPYARWEIDAVASCFGLSTRLAGPEATEERLSRLISSREAGRIDVLHLATHALIDWTDPQRSALTLSRTTSDGNPTGGSGSVLDNLVTAKEIALTWRLGADLVTLSSCQTGSGPRGRTGEPLGFLQALLRAGVRSVVASRWKVDDVATALLMARFYANLTGSGSGENGGSSPGPMTKAEALREARIWLRDLTTAEGRRPFAHPVYWAGFVLFGDPN